ncbi:hypothetical protein BOTBODRAFT_404429 [Botryobasidium botryosum FD-172 SS1]|uniref:Uncharacterized protein n=1 Tax=Botryobasidium botryosum (strain FD-172 SS1) TaxID=930990 RepID=A0A067MDX6_BOTB1|nr:hypothetical protein BOTBODRAFT_404429 [Botryobasidium botryosum FD-172 SS1]
MLRLSIEPLSTHFGAVVVELGLTFWCSSERVTYRLSNEHPQSEIAQFVLSFLHTHSTYHSHINPHLLHLISAPVFTGSPSFLGQSNSPML